MKTTFLILSFFISSLIYCQDSTKVQVYIQSRDCKYIAAISSKDSDEGFFDATKSKFRVLFVNLPTGTTLVQVDSIYTFEWIKIYDNLKRDAVALNSGVTGRIETILRAVNQPYLNGRLDDINATALGYFLSTQTIGLYKLRKSTTQ